jgi:S-adenosyl methyltransferase
MSRHFRAGRSNREDVQVSSRNWHESVIPDEPPGPDIDTSVPHIARVYDYWIGGKNNFAADRQAADQAIAAFPGLPAAARANRQFLGRAVRHLAGEAGIRQFLDIGTGIPATNNTHEVAQSVAPESRIVYVDNDPIVLAHARALLTSAPEGACAYLDADLRDTGTILEDAAQTLDFSQPVAIMLIAIMHMINDVDEPHAIVARLVDAVPSGSYLALSHVASDTNASTGSRTGAEAVAEGNRRYNQAAAEPVLMRTRDQVAAFFDGLEMLDPGLVTPPQWRPEPDTPDIAAPLWCGVARKP